MFDRETVRIWNAMDMGPIWLLRETPDPAFDEFTQARLAGAAPAASASSGESAPQQRGAAAPAAPARPIARAAAVPPVQAPASRNQPYAAKPVPVAGVSMPPELAERIRSLDWAGLRETALGCACCPMKASRHNVVFAEGEPGPKLVIVGEAPGSEEDLQGIPFVGKSGQLLTSMLESLSIVRREGCVILNVLKCRPPGNRNPEPAEIACCTHYLMRQIELLEPKVLFLMGRFASQALIGLQPGAPLGRMRGRVHEANVGGRTIPAVATYHPSYLLRSPDQKARAWEDLCLLRRVMRDAGISLRTKEKHWD